jgi:DNA mismatch repair protein MutS
MSGKSTFLRQNALIAILAQIGSYVPASSAKIGVVDKIFSRIGAGDDLQAGQSTFMVEMLETSAILAQSTKNSLVILDEVGRGTSTYDGVSIAWSVLEHIHDQLKCRCLFATHYHELTNMSNFLPSLKNYTVSIEELGTEILFLHNIIEGMADKSYGIHVASLAGLPKSVIIRANEILLKLEKTSTSKGKNILSSESSNLSLFNLPIESKKEIKYNKLEQEINNIDPDQLSPKQALELIYKFKGLIL